MLLKQEFFDEVRSLFSGRLTEGQVDGMQRIAAAAPTGVHLSELAYVLATVFHETARWMQPIREGAIRYGPEYTDQQSVRAVTALFNKGIIRTNYALPDSKGNSFYGRGLVQITWKENYRKFSDICGVDLVSTPDAALEWDNALAILFTGMKLGLFTGKRLEIDPSCDLVAEWINCRAVVNGDVRKNGSKIAAQAAVFHAALQIGAYEEEDGDASADDGDRGSFLADLVGLLWPDR